LGRELEVASAAVATAPGVSVAAEIRRSVEIAGRIFDERRFRACAIHAIGLPAKDMEAGVAARRRVARARQRCNHAARNDADKLDKKIVLGPRAPLARSDRTIRPNVSFLEHRKSPSRMLLPTHSVPPHCAPR